MVNLMGEYDYNTRLEITRKRDKDLEQRMKKAKLTGHDRELAREISNRELSGKNITKAGEEFYKNEEKKPSDWIRQKDQLLDVFVPKGFQDSYLYIIDKLNQFPFSRGWYRRMVRTKGYGPQVWQMFSLLKTYEKLFFLKERLEDYMMRRLDEETLDYIKHDWNFGYNFSYLYAAEIDRGNQGVIRVLKDLILSENNTAYLDREMILGILRSDNEELQKLLCDLLLAARLQEGLRQAVCETMGEGTEAAFEKLLAVIEKEDLIRYPSVQRAVSTWIGIFNENSVDRVNKKMLNLMGQALRDKEFCAGLLKENDAVAINVALWAMGAREVKTAIEAMKGLIEHGTKAQKLAASYYNQTLFDDSFKIQMAKKVVLEETEDLELVAAFFKAFDLKTSSHIQNLLYDRTNNQQIERKTPKIPTVTDYFESREDAENQYQKFVEIFSRLPKKGLVFSPCIFPWYQVSLSPSEVVCQMAFTAYVLRDEDKITKAAEHLGEAEGYSRRNLMTLLLHSPKNQRQREMLIGYMGNAESGTSKRAIELVKRLKLESQDFVWMEHMLRFKRSGLRGELIGFLMTQSEKDMPACLERLLTDKLEEKREAGLDMLLRLSKSESKKVLYEKTKVLAEKIERPTDKEKILIQEIVGGEKTDHTEKKGNGIYDPEAPFEILEPKMEKEWKDCCLPLSEKEIIEKLKKLDRLVELHKDYEYEASSGDKELLGNKYMPLKQPDSKKKADQRNVPWSQWMKETYCLANYPLESVFREFYEKEIGTYEAFIQIEGRILLQNWEIYKNGREFYLAAFGRLPYDPLPMSLEHLPQIQGIRTNYRFEYLDRKSLFEESIQVIWALSKVLTAENQEVSYQYRGWNDRLMSSKVSVKDLPLLSRYFDGLKYWETDEEFTRAFYTAWNLELKCKIKREQAQFSGNGGGRYYGSQLKSLTPITPYWFIKAFHMGLISWDILCKAVMEYFYRTTSLNAITRLVKGDYAKIGSYSLWRDFFGEELARSVEQGDPQLLGESSWCRKLIQELYDRIVPVIVDTELRRGEAETPFSSYIVGIAYISGCEYLIRILMALGKDPLGRRTYYSWYYSASNTKQEVLSRLLKVCYPREGEDGNTLKAALESTSIKKERLVEVAMYAPQWIDLIQEYLGWTGLKSGCYYFMAHMNERFDDQKKAMIAKYTPLNAEELQDGAFDVEWFEEAYGLLGEKNFGILYKAAKYISDGQKHSRARKYADAATGKVTLKELRQEIEAKRNKDLLMSYGLVPFEKDRERDMLERYQFIQQYLKESRQFGAQRRASEGKAAEIALVNLSVRAGFADVTRLKLRMESCMAKAYASYMDWKTVEDLELRLHIGENGKSEIQCQKNGKVLKSLPSRVGKNPYVLEVKEANKKLKDQYSRARKMMEESMESGAEFLAGEIASLWENPVVKAILQSLVFVSGKQTGMFVSENGGYYLENYEGQKKKISEETSLRIAHPLDLYQLEIWHEYQKYLFEHEICQPFKQVFRELYVKLPEEMGLRYSRMFAGNQIQPQKTVGCLKSRRWIADYEEGLQKVYYKENIIARIYALADWFAPSDVEAPTLEWVEFSDRKTFETLTIEKVPNLIYSEVMRDVDLAVSVAHAGGVDPETSHSTIQMRRAIVEFNLPLFGITNVTLTDSHAIIKGTRASYNVHLGSGVIHQEGGPMLHILPVHNQKRGKLFLPFVDEDPKTAEIMSKIVLLAEDKKIKDPFILEQIV